MAKPAPKAGRPELRLLVMSIDVLVVVKLFWEVFSCRLVVRPLNKALLLASRGFEIYLNQKEELHSRPYRQGLGVQFSMWAADSPDDFERIAARLRARQHGVHLRRRRYDNRRGTARDGPRMIVAYPPPRELARTTIAARNRR